jgi:hypothetical protein
VLDSLRRHRLVAIVMVVAVVLVLAAVAHRATRSDDEPSPGCISDEIGACEDQIFAPGT